jgi:hypothetical protein
MNGYCCRIAVSGQKQPFRLFTSGQRSDKRNRDWQSVVNLDTPFADGAPSSASNSNVE